MITLAEEYINQNTWRNWESYIEKLSIDGGHTILDFGCSIGAVSKLLAKKAHRVIGIDNHPEFLEQAKRINSAGNIQYYNMDLTSIDKAKLPLADGIWTSFVVAYFPDLVSLLKEWKNFLKPKGWIAVVEMSDLFGHSPQSQSTRNLFKEYYMQQRQKKIYDFEMGSRIKELLIKSGFSIIHEENKTDPELSFNGPAEPQILKSWNCRFDRMPLFKEYVGDVRFLEIKKEFLDCLTNHNHKSESIVKFLVAQR